MEGFEGRAQHRPLKEVPCFREAGRVQEDELGGFSGQKAGDPLPGRLGLGGDDGEVLAHQAVEQRGLPRVRAPDEGDVAGSGDRAGLVGGFWWLDIDSDGPLSRLGGLGMGKASVECIWERTKAPEP